jgi:hypothetical protein
LISDADADFYDVTLFFVENTNGDMLPVICSSKFAVFLSPHTISHDSSGYIVFTHTQNLINFANCHS